MCFRTNDVLCVIILAKVFHLYFLNKQALVSDNVIGGFTFAPWGTILVITWTIICYQPHLITLKLSVQEISFEIAKIPSNISYLLMNIYHPVIKYRADSRFAPSQCESSLQSDTVSHCLGSNLKSALKYMLIKNDQAFRDFVLYDFSGFVWIQRLSTNKFVQYAKRHFILPVQFPVLTHHTLLTHLTLDKMATISQRTCSNAFSWMKIFEFQVKFHWNIFLWV